MAFSIAQGALDPPLQIPLTVNGIAEDITDVTGPVQLLWYKPDGSTALVTLDVTNAPLGLVRRTWVAGDTDLPGLHWARVMVTRGDGKPEVFPSDNSWVRWSVTAKVAGF